MLQQHSLCPGLLDLGIETACVQVCQTLATTQLVSRPVRPLQQHILCPGLPIPCNNTQLVSRFVRPLQQHSMCPGLPDLCNNTPCVQVCQTLARTQLMSRFAMCQTLACSWFPTSPKISSEKAKYHGKLLALLLAQCGRYVLVLNYRRKATTKWA